MKTRELNPARLDLTKLAHVGTPISGELDLETCERVALVQDRSGAPAQRRIRWSARAELRSQRSGPKQTWLHLGVNTALPMQCQRCLEPVEIEVKIARWFLVVSDEATAAKLDAELEEADVLAAEGALDLFTLIEDEVLLSLPAVPMHDTCPRSVPMTYVAVPEGAVAALPGVFDDATAGASSPGDTVPDHPFAALAALKRSPSQS